LEKTLTYDVGMTTTETRAPLSRERIIDAAVAFADEHGVEELSMRKLGAELGVEAMSLYNHVANKDDILDGMIDYVFDAIGMPDPDMDWKQSIRSIGAEAMEQFTRHSWMVTVLIQRGNVGPTSLLFMNQVLGILRDAGLSDEDTHHAWQMLASHTMGYAFQQSSGSGHEKEWEDLQVRVIQMADQIPHVVALAPLLAECEFGTEFAFGLEIIISGLEARLSRD
jgi:AcrR family transcriptional regulator